MKIEQKTFRPSTNPRPEPADNDNLSKSLIKMIHTCGRSIVLYGTPEVENILSDDANDATTDCDLSLKYDENQIS